MAARSVDAAQVYAQIDWLSTVCGKIYENLTRDQGLKVEVEGKERERTVFHVSEVSVEIYTLNLRGGVGDRLVALQACAEAWQVRRFTWWRQAVSSLGDAIVLLPVPAAQAAQEAGLASAYAWFDASGVASRLRLQLEDVPTRIVAYGRIEGAIQGVCDRALAPDFRLTHQVGTLRLVPQTPFAHTAAGLQQAGTLLIQNQESVDAAIQKLGL